MHRIIIAVALIAGALGAAEGDPPETPVIEQKVCPVMGGKINPKLFVEQDGKRIYVCCAGCIAPIKKDFAKYLELVEEQIAKDKAATETPAKEDAATSGEDPEGK